MEKKEFMNEAFESVLITVGVVGLSLLSKKVFKEKLTDATDVKDTLKLAAGVTASTMIVKYAQDKKWIPTDPFKT